MKACGHIGVRATSAALAILLVLAPHRGAAEEFGNIFGSGPVVQEARAASASALDALSTVFAAIRKLELEDNSGRDELIKASSMLNQASGQMAAIKLDGAAYTAPFDPARLPKEQFDRLLFYSQRMGAPPPANLSDTYILMGNATRRMASLIEANAAKDPVLPALAGELAAYINFGAAVSVIFKALEVPSPQ